MLIDLLDAVAEELNNTQFSQVFTAERAYLPRWKLKDSRTIEAKVCLKGIEQIPADRGRTELGVDVWVALAKHVPGTGASEALKLADQQTKLDALIYLIEEIQQHFRPPRQLAACEAANCVAVEAAPVYDPEQLETKDLFFSLTTLSFIVYQASLD